MLFQQIQVYILRYRGWVVQGCYFLVCGGIREVIREVVQIEVRVFLVCGIQRVEGYFVLGVCNEYSLDYGILWVEWFVVDKQVNCEKKRMEGKFGVYKIFKRYVSIKKWIRGQWLRMYIKVIKLGRYLRK